MTDILGPSGASFAVTTRPADTRTPGALDTWFTDCTSATNDDGTDIDAEFLNALLANLRGLVRVNGQTAGGASVVGENNADGMLAASMQNLIQRGTVTRAADVGGVNALVANVTPVPVELVDGMRLRIRAAFANTGPAVLTVGGFQRPIVLPGAVALSGGELQPIWQDYTYDATAAAWQIQAQSSALPDAAIWHIGSTPAGVAPAYTTTLTPAPRAAAVGLNIRMPLAVALAANASLDFGFGPKAIVSNRSGTALIGVETVAGMNVDLSYVGGVLRLMNAERAAGFPKLVQISNTSNYVPSPGARRIAVLATAPGGPGGSGTTLTGGGGGAGESVFNLFDVASLALPILCTIGAPSAPTTPASTKGTRAPLGSPTSFGGLLQANAGQGGLNNANFGSAAAGGSGGTGGLSFPGAPGENFGGSAGGNGVAGGNGGESLRSGGGIGYDGDSNTATSAPANGGGAPGPGGGGGGGDASNNAGAFTGGLGGPGEILVLEMA